jgi:hypothetical protein
MLFEKNFRQKMWLEFLLKLLLVFEKNDHNISLFTKNASSIHILGDFFHKIIWTLWLKILVVD